MLLHLLDVWSCYIRSKEDIRWRWTMSLTSFSSLGSLNGWFAFICRLLKKVVTLDFWYLFLMLVWLTFNIGLSWHPRVVFIKAFLFPSPTLIRSGGEGEWPFSGARRFLADQSEWFINHNWTILFGFRGGEEPGRLIKRKQTRATHQIVFNDHYLVAPAQCTTGSL